MNGTCRIVWWKFTLLSMLILLAASSSSAQTTSFTYQGRLNDAGNPATGIYDLQFRLFDALSGGNQVGSTLVRDDVNVTGGSFSVTLDFGTSAFPGANRWLEISVRPGTSTGAFTTLSPHQPITSTPYAIKSANAATADGLSAACTGCVSSTQIGSLPTNSTSYIQNSNSQQASSNFNISGNGVVGGALGVGTGTAPTDGVIHAVGQNPVRILGETTTLIADEIVDFFAHSTPFNSELGGMRIQRQPATGNIDTLFFAAQAGNQATEKMRITGNGNVAINHPVDTTHTVSVGAVHADGVFGSSVTGKGVFGNSIDGAGVYGISSTSFGVYGSSTATTPSSRSGVYGTAGGVSLNGAVGSPIGVWGDSRTGIGVYGLSDSGNGLRGFSHSGNAILAYSVSGNAGFFQGNVIVTQALTVTGNVCAANFPCASDRRLKQQITNLNYGLNHLMQLRPVSWLWKDPTNQQSTLGLIAQEVEEVIPELILREADPAKPLGLNYIGLVPVVIKAIQEQQATITALKNENARIQQQNIDLETRLARLEQLLLEKKVH